MKKYARLRKKLITEGGIAAAIIAALIATIIFIEDNVTTEEQQQRVLKSNIQSLASQISNLEKKHGIVNKSMSEFRRLKDRQRRGDFKIDRDQATDIFNTLRRKYRISNLSMTITPKSTMINPELERPTAEITFSEASLEFDAMSDIHVFSFIHDAEETLSGFLRITQFQIERQRKITPDVYISLSKGEEPRMISARVNFMWLGIDEKHKVTDEAN